MKVESKCENQLPNVAVSNNSSHSDQHHITQSNGDIESQNTPSLQIHVNPEQISNNVQNGLSPEVLNIDLQSQPELDKINKLKGRVFIGWIKVQSVEIRERNPLPKIRNTNKNQSTISKINIVVKNIIDEQKPDLTSLNHLIYASAVISTKLCNVKIKVPKSYVPKKLAWQERIQKQINTLRSDLETLKNVRNNNNVKISKSRKLKPKYKIKRPEEIQNVLEKIKQAIQAKAARLRRYQKRSRFYKDNNLFKNNPKQFYRNNSKSQIKINKAPSEEEIRSFWEKIWSKLITLKLRGFKLSKEYEALNEQKMERNYP